MAFDFNYWMDKADQVWAHPNGTSHEVAAFAQLAQAVAMDRLATKLEELLEKVERSSCGHGTPTLFSPCVDCQRRDNGQG